MVKYFQTICRQQPTNGLSMFDHIVGWSLKGLTHFMALLYTNQCEKVKMFSAVSCLAEIRFLCKSGVTHLVRTQNPPKN